MKKMRILALLMTILVVATSMVGCGKSSTGKASSSSETRKEATADATSADTIKVGCIFPISGNNADQGVFNVDGCQFAVDQINAAGGIKSLGGAKLELVPYDNQSDADQSKAAAERLINENPDIVAVTGAGSSSYVLPMLPVFEKSQIPFLTAQVSESITSQGYKYAVRFGSTGASFSEYQVKFVEWLNEQYNLGIKKIGIVYEDTEWGISSTSGAVAAMKKSAEAGSGLEVVYNESFGGGSSDLTNIVVGLKKAGCEVVFPTCYTQDAKLLFNTMKSMNYNPLIIGGGGGFLYPSFTKELGDLVDGVVSVTGHNYDVKTITDNADLVDIGAKFEEEYGYFMPEQAVSGYSAIYLIAQALEKTASKDPSAVCDAVKALTCSSTTPGGVMKFDETGANTNAHAVIIQWQKGDDGVYRTRSVFPDTEAGAAFQLPADLAKKTK
ncbi:ABC transporter substrate-binding protein [Anaerobium acetethylicum]|uniref:Branched-chain amino acid transport system substrate-binding protein n=1 Tax=Anaerobium acetethylicum TaxID=1619234 RepID=A0A1D3TYC7_9FIRM|nr:ABC transporter substrate-binding protein [Anaerobium acetethylicum]SCP99460.1 branched-chain amino acid transport system substrate-binding protein [Anaerobium acetethylicum]